MYRLLLYNVIYIIIIVSSMTTNCLHMLKKKKKKGSDNSNTPPKPPITYETDPDALEIERKLKIAENRERMKKKREKQQRKKEEPSVPIPVRSVKPEKPEKPKEKVLLPEDKTQSTTTTTTTDSGTIASQEKSEAKMSKTQPNDDEKPTTNSRGSSDEELGDVKLIGVDSNAEKKNQLVNKKAQEEARRKLQVDLTKVTEKSESSRLGPADDTLRNISSIHAESAQSLVIRKKKKEQQKQKDAVKTVGDTNTVSTESQMIMEAEVVEPKSNPMYIKEFTQKVLGGSAEPSGSIG
ncbi:hypothetical protein GCK72_004658 [Caenorhabditis remanei]|uniref:Uncharacterized protein n=1 Tax=Caenorhabditis remanei TaxID=31234 RepID=A0A6A5HAB4_CAERE|nr:hypothetical protein GCK72_004658 [Caenorhabditis remanei]KAF1764708.1 hypothetical protein GCK72_004658 [Caenorhabditis remanei]